MWREQCCHAERRILRTAVSLSRQERSGDSYVTEDIGMMGTVTGVCKDRDLTRNAMNFYLLISELKTFHPGMLRAQPGLLQTGRTFLSSHSKGDSGEPSSGFPWP